VTYQRGDELYHPEPKSVSLADCHFYHTMEIPGHGVVWGDWDIREGAHQYLGGLDFAGKRVLEVGPASGFLTFEIEKRGADVVCVELEDQPGWDFVPFPPAIMDPVYADRREIMRRLKNSFWFAHKAHRSNAKVHYGNVYDLPDALGRFDIAIMTSVLLHCRDPLKVVQQCAIKADTLVVTDMHFPELEGSPVSRLVPTRENRQWDTWWNFSSTLFHRYFGVLGFAADSPTVHRHMHMRAAGYDFFTIVGRRLAEKKG
jgi:SAM-dependent methyltransferase